MSPKLHYTVTITNLFTHEVKVYEINGSVYEVVKAINEHYGCYYTTHAGVCNIITRPQVVSKRYAGIEIARFQTPTRTYMEGEGGSHTPLVIST